MFLYRILASFCLTSSLYCNHHKIGLLFNVYEDDVNSVLTGVVLATKSEMLTFGTCIKLNYKVAQNFNIAFGAYHYKFDHVFGQVGLIYHYDRWMTQVSLSIASKVSVSFGIGYYIGQIGDDEIMYEYILEIPSKNVGKTDSKMPYDHRFPDVEICRKASNEELAELAMREAQPINDCLSLRRYDNCFTRPSDKVLSIFPEADSSASAHIRRDGYVLDNRHSFLQQNLVDQNQIPCFDATKQDWDTSEEMSREWENAKGDQRFSSISSRSGRLNANENTLLYRDAAASSRFTGKVIQSGTVTESGAVMESGSDMVRDEDSVRFCGLEPYTDKLYDVSNSFSAFKSKPLVCGKVIDLDAAQHPRFDYSSNARYTEAETAQQAAQPELTQMRPRTPLAARDGHVPTLQPQNFPDTAVADIASDGPQHAKDRGFDSFQNANSSPVRPDIFNQVKRLTSADFIHPPLARQRCEGKVEVSQTAKDDNNQSSRYTKQEIHRVGEDPLSGGVHQYVSELPQFSQGKELQRHIGSQGGPCILTPPQRRAVSASRSCSSGEKRKTVTFREDVKGGSTESRQSKTCKPGICLYEEYDTKRRSSSNPEAGIIFSKLRLEGRPNSLDLKDSREGPASHRYGQGDQEIYHSQNERAISQKDSTNLEAQRQPRKLTLQSERSHFPESQILVSGNGSAQVHSNQSRNPFVPAEGRVIGTLESERVNPQIAGLAVSRGRGGGIRDGNVPLFTNNWPQTENYSLQRGVVEDVQSDVRPDVRSNVQLNVEPSRERNIKPNVQPNVNVQPDVEPTVPSHEQLQLLLRPESSISEANLSEELIEASSVRNREKKFPLSERGKKDMLQKLRRKKLREQAETNRMRGEKTIAQINAYVENVKKQIAATEVLKKQEQKNRPECIEKTIIGKSPSILSRIKRFVLPKKLLRKKQKDEAQQYTGALKASPVYKQKGDDEVTLNTGETQSIRTVHGEAGRGNEILARNLQPITNEEEAALLEELNREMAHSDIEDLALPNVVKPFDELKSDINSLVKRLKEELLAGDGVETYKKLDGNKERKANNENGYEELLQSIKSTLKDLKKSDGIVGGKSTLDLLGDIKELLESLKNNFALDEIKAISEDIKNLYSVLERSCSKSHIGFSENNTEVGVYRGDLVDADIDPPSFSRTSQNNTSISDVSIDIRDSDAEYLVYRDLLNKCEKQETDKREGFVTSEENSRREIEKLAMGDNCIIQEEIRRSLLQNDESAERLRLEERIKNGLGNRSADKEKSCDSLQKSFQNANFNFKDAFKNLSLVAPDRADVVRIKKTKDCNMPFKKYLQQEFTRRLGCYDVYSKTGHTLLSYVKKSMFKAEEDLESIILCFLRISEKLVGQENKELSPKEVAMQHLMCNFKCFKDEKKHVLSNEIDDKTLEQNIKSVFNDPSVTDNFYNLYILIYRLHGLHKKEHADQKYIQFFVRYYISMSGYAKKKIWWIIQDYTSAIVNLMIKWEGIEKEENLPVKIFDQDKVRNEKYFYKEEMGNNGKTRKIAVQKASIDKYLDCYFGYITDRLNGLEPTGAINGPRAANLVNGISQYKGMLPKEIRSLIKNFAYLKGVFENESQARFNSLDWLVKEHQDEIYSIGKNMSELRQFMKTLLEYIAKEVVERCKQKTTEKDKARQQDEERKLTEKDLGVLNKNLTKILALMPHWKNVYIEEDNLSQLSTKYKKYKFKF